MTMVQIVTGVRLLALTSLRSDCLLLRLLPMSFPAAQDAGITHPALL